MFRKYLEIFIEFGEKSGAFLRVSQRIFSPNFGICLSHSVLQRVAKVIRDNSSCRLVILVYFIPRDVLQVNPDEAKTIMVTLLRLASKR